MPMVDFICLLSLFSSSSKQTSYYWSSMGDQLQLFAFAIYSLSYFFPVVPLLSGYTSLRVLFLELSTSQTREICSGKFFGNSFYQFLRSSSSFRGFHWSDVKNDFFRQQRVSFCCGERKMIIRSHFWDKTFHSSTYKFHIGICMDFPLHMFSFEKLASKICAQSRRV